MRVKVEASRARAGDDRGSVPAGVAEGCHERVEVSAVDDHFLVLGWDVEAGEEVVEGFGGDGQRVGVLALVAFGQAPQQLGPVGGEVDDEGVAACFAGGPPPGVALSAAP